MKDMARRMIAYDQGALSGDEVIAFFQELVDTGRAWTLPGRYGRTAERLIALGVVTVPPAREANRTATVAAP